MNDPSGFTIQPANEFAETEANEAKRYWSSLQVPDFYKQPQTHWSTFIADQVLRLKPKSVLEFGCNVGRNLLTLRASAPGLVLKGVDLNGEAVAFGRQERGLDLVEGDETFLQRLPNAAFDVIFTVSVMDHLSNPQPVVTEMVRTARLAVLLLEPSLAEEGKVLKKSHPQNGASIEATPYSYSWDYPRLIVGLPVELSSEPYPLSGTQLGPYYRLFRLLKRPSNA